MKRLYTLVALGILGTGIARAESNRVICHVQPEMTSVRCPEADRILLPHMAWMHADMFRGGIFPPNLKPNDTLSCGVNSQSDLADCILRKK